MKLAGVVCAALAALGARDVVTLKDGKSLEGRVVRDTPSELVLRVGRKDRVLSPDDIARVESTVRALREVLARWVQLAPGDLEGVKALVARCQDEQLAGEARVFALYGLTLATTDETLHLAAGHEQRGDRWQVRRGSKREDFDKRTARQLDWNDAWELETTHFSLRCDLDLAATVASALELELCYFAFADWFAEPLPIFEPDQRMKAHVYASSASFPEFSSRRAYFDPQANVLHVDASGAADWGALAHEATHQILFNTSSNPRAALGALPAWLDEGLAEYMAACREGVSGRSHYSRGKKNAAHFATHAAAEKPYELTRMLTFDLGDFAASTKSQLKYAQAYTLVHFCLHGRGEEPRKRFFEFLHRAYAGKSSMTDFKDAMDVKPRDFDEEWSEYVAAEARR